MGWRLPLDPDPPDTICIQLQVPNDPNYLDAFWGAILDLSVGFNWANDSAHTAILAANRMRLMYAQAQLNNCAVCPKPIPPGFHLEDNNMNIRQDPDNPCLLREVCPDGSLGCTIFDASLCIKNPQPGPPQPQPAPGICLQYTLTLDASKTALIPVAVNTGDTIKLIVCKGAGADGGGDWYCANGQLFFAGVCLGIVQTRSTDPMPAAPHMSPITTLGGTLIDFTTGVLNTVPANVVGQQPVIQVNDSTLSDNSGTFTLVFEVCNNQTPPAPGAWCFDFDFTVSDGGFVQAAGYNGVYTPGVGWVASTGFLGLLKTIPANGIFTNYQSTLTAGADADYELGTGYANPPGSFGTTLVTSPPTVQPFAPVSVPGGFQFFYGSGAGPATLTHMKFAGNGPCPFGLANCVP